MDFWVSGQTGIHNDFQASQCCTKQTKKITDKNNKNYPLRLQKANPLSFCVSRQSLKCRMSTHLLDSVPTTPPTYLTPPPPLRPLTWVRCDGQQGWGWAGQPGAVRGGRSHPWKPAQTLESEPSGGRRHCPRVEEAQHGLCLTPV